MCGIVGSISESLKEAQFTAALDLMKHRGPFGRGISKFEGGWLGMNRLPMSSNEDFVLPVQFGEQIAAFNGEIYSDENDLNLEAELELIFEGISTGVFPEGMYSFAVMDPSTGILSIGRDPLGIKPLYWYLDPTGKEFHFASELAPLMALISASRPIGLNRSALAEILSIGVSLQYETPLEGINIFRPGELLQIDFRSSPLKITKRSLKIKTRHISSPNLDQMLEHSIRRTERTFRKVGLLLSGGVDSTLINSYMPKETLRFHVDVHGMKESIAGKVPLEISNLKPEMFWETLRKAVKNYCQPTRMSSVLMYQVLAELVHEKGYHCVFLGEGADEIFWGYPRHLKFAKIGKALTPLDVSQAFFGDYATMASLFSEEEESRIVNAVNEISSRALRDEPNAGIFDMDLQYSLEPLLRRADHLLMAYTIEARTPFLHFGIPTFAKSYDKQRVLLEETKVPLRRLLEKRVPEYSKGPKKHFRIPFDLWNGFTEEMRKFLNSHIDTLSDLGLVRINSDQLKKIESRHLFTLCTAVFWKETVWKGDL